LIGLYARNRLKIKTYLFSNFDFAKGGGGFSTLVAPLIVQRKNLGKQWRGEGTQRPSTKMIQNIFCIRISKISKL